jgi:5-methylcytosine-specific restriction endonuclease McrA
MARFIDKEAITVHRSFPCEICLWHDEGNCAHHLKTRGSGGGDEWFNLMTLCIRCHSMVHDYGYNKMIIKQPRLLKGLLKRGWFKDENEKWKCIHQMAGDTTEGFS